MGRDNMVLKMSRGRTQSIFRYLPEQTFNWSGKKGTFRGVNEISTREMDIPRVWVQRHLKRLLRPFKDSARAVDSDIPIERIINGERYHLLEPTRLRGEFFPRTFICKDCGRFFESDSPYKGLKCPDCSSNDIIQWSFVEFHECGHLSPLQAPYCTNGCGNAMRLVNRTSRNFGDWEWECKRCETRQQRGVYRRCPECGRGNVAVLRAGANPVFYAQTIRVVNPPTRSERTLLETEGVYKASIAQSMDFVSPGLDSLVDALNDEGGNSKRERERQRLIEDYGFEEGSQEIGNLLEKHEKHSTGGSSVDWRKKVEDMGLSEEKIKEFGHRSLEFTLAKDADPVTFDDLIENAPSESYRAMYEIEYSNKMDKYNFSNVVLLREFPLAYIVAGYTRNERDPEEKGVIFQFFDRTEQNEYPMYGRKNETEAILFQIDPEEVILWLKKSGLIDRDEEAKPKEYLFSNMVKIESIFKAPPDKLSNAVLGLIHSISHKALKALAISSGLSADSLSEYIFPYNLSFIIYADTRSEFTLGGLENIYRNKLNECLSKMDKEKKCIFDPPCYQDKGACAYCMFLSEGSCERFNTALSRHYLFGGKHEEVQWKGFWTS